MFFVQPACNQHNAISSFFHFFHLFQLIDPYDFFILDLCEIMLALLLFEAHYLISVFRCFGQFVVPGRYSSFACEFDNEILADGHYMYIYLLVLMYGSVLSPILIISACSEDFIRPRVL